MASLFGTFRLKEVVLRNRIAVSPMCQYSSDDGYLNDWHLVHLGSRAVGGAGLPGHGRGHCRVAEGRISSYDSGICLDEHVEAFSRISQQHQLAVSQSAKVSPPGGMKRWPKVT